MISSSLICDLMFGSLHATDHLVCYVEIKILDCIFQVQSVPSFSELPY